MKISMMIKIRPIYNEYFIDNLKIGVELYYDILINI